MRQPFLPFMVAASLLVLLAGCQTSAGGSLPEDAWGTVTIRRGDPVRVAVATARSAGLFEIGVDQLRGAELAALEFGRIKGFPIELIPFDTECSASLGAITAEVIVDDPSIVAVIGHTCSESCLAALPVYTDARLTFISPSCGTLALTDPVIRQQAFLRSAPGDSDEGIGAATFAFLELGRRRAAIVYDGSAESRDAVEAFQDEFARLGGEIVAVQQTPPGETNFQPALEQITESEADVIYAPLLPTDALAFTVQRAGAGLDTIPLIGSRFIWTRSFLEDTGFTAANLFAVGPVSSGVLFDELADVYAAQYDEQPETFAFAYAYDAMSILLSAVENVTTSLPDGSLLIGRGNLNEALHETAMYTGATGLITCTEWGDCNGGKVGVGQAQGERWAVIYIP